MSEAPSVSSRLHADGRGSKHYYDRGCRCDECREAKRVARKKYRDRARAVRSPAYLKELATSREAKRRARGTCRECGRETGYHGKGKRVSDLCHECSHTFTHCANGHEYTPETDLRGQPGYRNGGSWSCRICRNDYMREYQMQRRRAAGKPTRDPAIYESRRLKLTA